MLAWDLLLLVGSVGSTVVSSTLGWKRRNVQVDGVHEPHYGKLLITISFFVFLFLFKFILGMVLSTREQTLVTYDE